jgi:hypothetical protein
MASCCNYFRIFFGSLALSSQSGIFLYPSVPCDVSFHQQFKALESDTVRRSNELYIGRCRSRRWMASCCNHFRIFFVSLALISQSGIFLYRSIACDVSFDSELEAPESDTLRGSNELFIGRCRSRWWMASCCNHFRIFFVSLALRSQCGIFLYPSVTSDVSFHYQFKAPNPILYEGALSFLSDAVALVGGWLLAATTFVFSSSLWP